MLFLSSNDKLVTAWTAIAALFVSFVSIVIAISNMVMQRRHNRKSVLPIGHIVVGDYESRIHVTLRNEGVGPMIVEKAIVTSRRDGEQISSAILEFLPDLPDGYLWTTFVGDISGRAISAGDDIILVSLEGDQNDFGFIAARQMTREALSILTIRVDYKNVYGEKMPSVTRALNWFGRLL